MCGLTRQWAIQWICLFTFRSAEKASICWVKARSGIMIHSRMDANISQNFQPLYRYRCTAWTSFKLKFQHNYNASHNWLILSNVAWEPPCYQMVKTTLNMENVPAQFKCSKVFLCPSPSESPFRSIYTVAISQGWAVSFVIIRRLRLSEKDR